MASLIRLFAFAGHEQTARRGLQPQRFEEVSRDRRMQELRRLAVHGDAGDPKVEGEDVRELGDALAVVLERLERKAIAHSRLVTRHVERDDDDLFRIGDGERTKEAVDDAEDGGVGADAERERQRRRDDEPRRSARLAQHGLDVSKKAGHDR